MINHQEVARRIWNDDRSVSAISLLSFLLFALSLPYRFAVVVRNYLYDNGILPSKKLGCPVISIGNLTAGGTGKTPLAILLGGMLKERGFRPAILSRGYGRKDGKIIGVVSDGSRILMDYQEAGDEPILMALLLPRIPIVVGASRYLTGEMAIQELGANILILDDGFQHRNLYRDIDIVLLENERPSGNNRLLPAGPLREPLESLRRADIIVLTGNNSDGASTFPKDLQVVLEDSGHCFHSFHKPQAIIDVSGNARELDFLQGKRIFAFCGIANPLSFRRTIEKLGASLAALEAFPDHHCYDASELALIAAQAKILKVDIILTTEKDGARLTDFPDFMANVFILRIKMAFIPPDNSFINLILHKLNRLN